MSASGDGQGDGGDGGKPSAPSVVSNTGGPPHGQTGYLAPHAAAHANHACTSPPSAGAGVVIVQQPAWAAPCQACACKGDDHGHDHGHAPADDLLPKKWNVPEHVHRELAQLARMAEDGGAPTATIGAAQAMLLVLLADLPAELDKPKTKKPKGFLGWWASLFEDAPPPPPDPTKGPDPAVILKRAFEDGLITRTMLEASTKLPLTRTTDVKTGSSKGKPFVRFLIELADVIHAQPARMA